MKFTRLLPSGLLALAMSLSVTTGAVYVTVNAAANSAATAASNVSAASNVNEVPTGSAVPTLTDLPESAVSFHAAEAMSSDVELAADGSLTAKFSKYSVSSAEPDPAVGAEVSLLSVDGTKMTTFTDADGYCAFGGLSPGFYTVNVAGTQGRLSYGIRAVAADIAVAKSRSESIPSPVSVGMSVLLDSALTPVGDDSAIERVISSVSVSPIEYAGTPSGGSPKTEYTATHETDGGSYFGHDVVQLNADGAFEGQLNLLDPATGGVATVKDLTVSFISGNTVAATTNVNSDGSFTQWNLLPGIYSVVFSGRDGIGYMGIDVIGNEAQVNRPGQAIPTAVRQPTPFSIGVVRGAGGSGSSGSGGENNEVAGDPIPLPFAGGGAAPGGGGFGGGGAAGGGGGLGGLLGLAAIGGIAAALADNNNSPASPGI